MSNMPQQLDEQFWNERYLTHNTGWDIGYISTPLQQYLAQYHNKHASILIPGCGNAYEAAYLLQSGFTQVTVVDISQYAIDAITRRLQPYVDNALTVVHADFFDLSGQYDLIVEQTFFCALHPSLRQQYAVHMHELLKPGGKLMGLFFNRTFDVSPPFGGSIAVYQNLFEPLFKIKKMEPCYNSIAARAHTELFVVLQK